MPIAKLSCAIIRYIAGSSLTVAKIFAPRISLCALHELVLQDDLETRSRSRSEYAPQGARVLSRGHGPLWDLAEDPASIRLIEATLQAGKPVALVCHAPGVLRHAKAPDGKPLVDGKDVTGFTNTEEEAVGLTEVVPFLVENELTRNGGNFSKADDWAPYVLADGLLITRQNPASSGPAAERLLERLANR